MKENNIKEEIDIQEKLKQDYWLKKISNTANFFSSPIPALVQGRHDSRGVEIEPAITSRIKSIARHDQVNQCIILLTVFSVLLYKYYRHPALIISSPGTKDNKDSGAGHSPLFYKFDIGPGDSIKNILERTHREFHDSMAYKGYDYTRFTSILERKKIEKGPLYRFGFFDQRVYKEYPESEQPGLQLRIQGTTNQKLQVRLKYRVDLFEKNFIRQMLSHYRNTLVYLDKNLDTEVEKVEILSAVEKQQLLFEMNRTAAAYPAEKTIERLFAEQVEKNPHHTALSFESQSLKDSPQITYKTLNQAAEAWAQRLQAKGAGPESIIALMLKPSIRMIMAILGILKAGGAYLPIAADNPEERVLTILNDARPLLLLVETGIMKNYSITALQGFSTIPTPPYVTQQRSQIRDFDGLPFPDRSLVSYEKYNRYIGLAMAKNTIALQGSRGCPYNCAYCHKIWPKNHVVRSAENLFAEVRLYYNMGIRRFVIVDDIFNLNKKNSSDFFRLIIDNGLDLQIFFPNGVRGDIMTKEYIDLMVQAGVTSIAFALETASPRLQKLIRKNLALKKLRENIEYFCEKYPHVILELFTMHGFPTETEEEALMTLDFIKSLKWLHFPYVHILKIYPNTDMATLAVDNGISHEAINRSANLAYHELPETLPFDKNFSLRFQADFLSEYFLCKERLLHVLPLQMKVLTEDEIVQKYDSYLPDKIQRFSDILALAGIGEAELAHRDFLQEKRISVSGLDEKINASFPHQESGADALRVLFLDLSQFFSHDDNMLYDVVEPPLGLMYVMTYLKKQLGGKLNGRIAKSRIDFDNYEGLKVLLDEFKPEIIGIRTLSFYKDFFHKTAAMMRHWGITVPIIAGGPYATSDYHMILQDPNVDLVVLSEGEITACQLMQEVIANNKKLPPETVLKEIPGLAFLPRSGSSSPSRTPRARELIMMDALVKLPENAPGQQPGFIQPSSSLAYIIYTSGSSGTPKGVMVEHRNVVRLMINDKNPFDFNNRDVWIMFHSYYFDFSVWEMYGALLYGGKLVVISREIARDANLFLMLLESRQITVLNQIPSVFNTLVSTALKGNEPRKLNLRCVIFGGDALHPSQLEKWHEVYPGVKLVNMYGITETTVHVTYKEIGPREIQQGKSNIGGPIPTLTCYIMDKNLGLEPLGIEGEIVVGGDGVSRGYLNRPELTHDKFKPNPYLEEERLYRSGDSGRRLEGGDIEFLGRIDNQVKIRGYRVESGEIESRLIGFAAIEEAVVTAREYVDGNKYLAVYFTAREEISSTRCREYLEKVLPDYMAPSFYQQLEKFPLTAAGKIDKKALPDPLAGVGSHIGREQPRTDLERELVKIWTEVLGIEKIGISDDFFSMGGNSIKGIRIVNKIQEILEATVQVTILFETSTIKELAAKLEADNLIESPGYLQKKAAPDYFQLQNAPEQEYYRLSHAQKRLWILAQLEENQIAYNIPKVMLLEGEINREILGRVFETIVRRHESLRTTFIVVEGEPRQRIHDYESLGFKLQYIDLRESKDPEKEVKNLVDKEVSTPFHLQQGPLIRVRLFQMEEEKYVFFFNMHHIICDGWSMNTLVNELLILYAADRENRPSPLAPLLYQYRDYSQWQNSETGREAMKRQEAFWLEEFSGEVPVLNLPTDFPRPAVQSSLGSSIAFDVEEKQTRKMLEYALQEKITQFILFISVYTVFLSKLSGQEDIIVGTGIVGRRHAELQEVIGMFANTLALRHYPTNAKTFQTFLKEVRRKTLLAFEHQDYPFDELVDKVVTTRDRSRNPLVNTVFLQQNLLNAAETPKLQVPGLNLLPFTDEYPTSKFDLSLYCSEIGDNISFTMVYCTKLFTRETMARFGTYFKTLLYNVMADPGQQISHLEIIPPAEKKKILFEFNNTAAPGNLYHEVTIHQLFEKQARQRPDVIAVSSPVDINEMFSPVSCFKKNRYMYESHLGPFKILKTNTHYKVVINKNMLKLIDLFTGENNLEAVFSILKDFKPAKFIIFISPKKDLLGIAHEFNRPPHVYSNTNYNDFISLVQLLYKNNLIEFQGVKAHASGTGKLEPGYFELNESFDQRTRLKDIIKNAGPGLVKTDVLLLGDTQGMPTTGLLYMASYLERNGVSALCRFYDDADNFQAMAADIENMLEQTRPRVVGISMKWFLYIARVIDMCKIIKEYSRRHEMDIKVVVGGNTAAYYWEELIKYDFIDYLARGDGEEPLLKIFHGEKDIPNCIYRQEGKIIENPITYIQDEKNSKEIYLSHLEEILPDRFTSLFGTFFVYTHKGCAMNCLYCGGCNKAQQKTFNRKHVLRRGIEEVRKDIIAVKEYASTLHFDFDIPDRNLADYCSKIWQGIDLTGHFCLFNTLTTPSPQLVELVSRTFKYVYWDLDICTPSERHRQQLQALGLVKPLPTDAEIMEFMTTCEDFKNIEVRPNLITGLPYFTPADIQPGEKLLTEMMSMFSCFGELHWARLHAQPGAPILENPQQLQMNSLATSFDHFMEYSRETFNRSSGYVSVEDFKYPYIYFNDDHLNSQVTNFYLEINKKIEQYKNDQTNDLIILEKLTYRHLNERAARLAGTLIARNVKPGDIVGLMLERSIDIPVGILAVLKCGAAYLPIDPEFPGGRIEYMLKDSNVGVLVTTPGLSEKFGKLSTVNCQLLMVNEMPPNSINNYQFTINNSRLEQASPAYIIYTSGTTGKPKGVAVKHENLVNYVNWFTNQAGLTDKDKTILTTSFAFDLGYTSLYNSLLNGGELHILPREIYLLAERLLAYIKQKEITFIKVTPSLFSAVVNSPGFSKVTCKSLRLAAVGGEPINVKDVETAHLLCGHLEIMNHYGPTEAAIGCVSTIIDFHDFEEYKKHPVIGKPIHNTRVYILDKNLNSLPVGVPGELCVSGACLARGYLNRPELTAQKFLRIPSMFNRSHRSYMSYIIYKTGDLARWLPNGTIEFLGRVDNQVKIRGYRIELGEIENRLLKHRQIKETVVVIKEASEIKGAGENDDKFLCAYIVPKEDAAGAITGSTSDDNRLLTLKDIREQENFDAPPGDYPTFKKEETEQSIVTLFKKKVKAYPGKVALESTGGSLTYRSLDDYSNRAAWKILQEYDDRYKLSKNERIRYKRQLLLHEWGYASQEKLKATTVFVAGAGGGASPTIVQLALTGFGTIVICDCDVVELSNLNRQFLHDESRIGMNKALSAKMTVERINPHVNVIAITQKLTRENSFELVGDADIILDMFDNLQDKFVLSRCAARKGIPHIVSAMTDINGYTVVFHPPATPCFHCIFDKKKLQEIVEGMGQYVDRYEKNPLPVAASSLFMSTGFAVNEAVKIVLGFETPAYNKFIFFNQRGTEKLAATESFKAMTYTFSDHFRKLCKQQGFDWDIGWRGNFLEELTIEPDPDCPVCSGKEIGKSRGNQVKIIKVKREKDIQEKYERNTQNVALLLNHGVDMAAGLLGILKAGKTYVPLDPDSSMERLAFILEDSESRIILTDDDRFDKVKTLRDQLNKNIKIINLARLETSNVNETAETEIQTNRDACVLYPPHTDNTAGAVIETQKSILEFIRIYTYNLQLTGKHSFHSHSTYSFNAGMIDLIAALLNGTGAYVFDRNKNKKEIDNPLRDSFSSKLREYLVEALPDYMIPSYFVQVEKIPMTPNGKVDVKALPAPALGAGNELHPLHKPRNEIEEKLTRIWFELLGIEKDKIGIDSNFFELGGHSLSATVMVTKIHRELNVKLSLGEVFTAPTIRGLAGLAKAGEEDIYSLIQPVEKREYYPLSSAQLRLFLLSQIKTDITSDNVSGVFSIDGSLEVRYIEDVFHQLINRHEVFRTSFETIDLQPVQRIHRAVSFKIMHIESGNVTGPLTSREINHMAKNIIRPFDLSKAPLLRVGLVKLAEQKHLIIYDMHHIISDGTSFPILVNEFVSLYGRGGLPGMRIQYKDFTHWQNNLLKSNVFKKQEEYWLELFSNEIPKLNLPTDYPREALQEFEGDFVNFVLEKDLTERIYEIADEIGATLYMVLLAIYNILLYKYTGQEDIVVGSSAAGRPHADLQNVLGFFVNTLPMRNYPKGEKTFMEFLTEVKSNALKAYENQDYQFDELVRRLGIQRDASRQVLFDTHFTLHKIYVERNPNPDVKIEDLRFERQSFEDKATQFDIIIHANETAEGVNFIVRYSKKLFKKNTMERFSGYYKEIAQTTADNKNIKLKDIKISHHLEAARTNMPEADFVF